VEDEDYLESAISGETSAKGASVLEELVEDLLVTFAQESRKTKLNYRY
jgi:hypothetical protein